MKNIEKTKMILGYILISFSIFGGFVSLTYLFDLGWIQGENLFFGPFDGGASNTPIFYGLSAIAGAMLLASITKEED